MKKKGQVYLLIAIILCFIIFGLFSIANKLVEKKIGEDFKILAKNYETESTKFLNLLIGEKTKGEINEDDIKKYFANFTALFTSYAKSQAPNFELLYIFKFNNNLYIGNYLKSRIKINNKEIDGCYDKIPVKIEFQGLNLLFGVDMQEIEDCNEMYSSFTGNSIEVLIGDYKYDLEISENRPEIVIISKEDVGEQTVVYFKGKIKKPKKPKKK